jgi:Asp-tRNA(Asn)/Glu-tRNA(Gln) amidotransferase A subunit family amidase
MREIHGHAGAVMRGSPIPVPDHGLPASLQLVAPHGREELLLPTAAAVEAALN